MMRSSSSCACWYSSVAAAPSFASVRMAGKDPFSSHVVKNSVQSMYLAISASGSSSRNFRPVNAGFGTSLNSSFGAFARAPAYVSSGRRVRLAYCERISACFFFVSAANLSAFSGWPRVRRTCYKYRAVTPTISPPRAARDTHVRFSFLFSFCSRSWPRVAIPRSHSIQRQLNPPWTPSSCKTTWTGLQ